jgi:alkylhydroperoxidase/carboxymuconolactone decarboxylase family protein YurZ
MQTYEVHSGDSMDSLLNALAALAQTDPEIRLIVPAHVQVLNQVDNLSRLRHFAADRGVRLHAAVADQVTLGLFRIMGLDATDTTSGGASAARTPADEERALAAEAENMNFDSEAYDRAVREEGLMGTGSSSERDRMLADAENMNFDIDELEQTLRAEGLSGTPHAPATAAPPPPPPAPEPEPAPSRSFFGRLKQMISPAPTTDAPADSGPAQDTGFVAMSQAGGPPSGEGTAPADRAMSGAEANQVTAVPMAGGLETTLPDWMREEPPPYVPERPAATAPPPGSGEPTMPDWLRADAPVPATRETAELPTLPAAPTMPAWMQGDTPAAGSGESSLPGWMQGETAAAPGETQTPDWLRETGSTPPAPATAWGADPTLPDWLRETDAPAGPMDSAPAPADAGAAPSIPDWLRAAAPPAPPAAESRAGVGMEPGPGPGNEAATPPGAWAGENVTPVPAEERLTVVPSNIGPPAPTETGRPDWLREDTAAAPAAPSAPSGGAADEFPDWLRETAPAAPPPVMAAEPELPDWLREDTAAPAPAAAEAAPPSVSAPPVPPAPPPVAVPPPAASGLDALGGPRQTPESITSAVQAAGGIDARTRSLLLFGMALVRLAPAEARAAADAAQRAGLTTDDLRLVVELAQALGGGPSERLGRRILEG